MNTLLNGPWTPGIAIVGSILLLLAFGLIHAAKDGDFSAFLPPRRRRRH